jgi:acylphosphatase
VEVFAQGETDNIDGLIHWLWRGPALAVVTGVESDVVAPDNTLRDFFIHPNPMKSG